MRTAIGYLAVMALGVAAIAHVTPGETMKKQTSTRASRDKSTENLLAGRFRWKTGPPLILPADRPHDPPHAIKDPTIVRWGGRWHVFCSVRATKRTHCIEYLSFPDWKRADSAPRHVLTLTDKYFSAPQVFYFRPHEKWYLIYQVVDKSRKPALQPACSTTDDISDPNSWTAPDLLFARHPENVKMWIDFWVICGRTRAHLFFTSLDGKMWRAETKLSDFPHGWSRPEVVLRADIFEASHVYRLRGMPSAEKFLAIVEAQAGGRRYFEAYLADRLDGKWRALAGSRKKPFASRANVVQTPKPWTDSISHGELIRHGRDETLQVDPANIRFLYQGVSDRDRRGKTYGDIPWKLGLLEPVR